MSRLAIEINGIVQGVGFRPFAHELAARFGLGGFVRNHAGKVEIEVEGPQRSLDRFVNALTTEAPPTAVIETISCRVQPSRGETDFHIRSSDRDQVPGHSDIFVSPDLAVCDDCLIDLFDPGNRRYLYPFVNCTKCGPRLTIIKSAPYDRQRTTMASFEMCPDCRREYTDPSNRRFHAEPTCCPKCGPKLEVLDSSGNQTAALDPIQFVADALRAGKIAAIKGLGGYHLACDARSEPAVRELRARKHRNEKPFAIMVHGLAAAQVSCELDASEALLLQSNRRPICLLRRRAMANIAESVSPGNPWLGVMLPYTPVHHLLMRAMEDIPLVMTSGNRSDEPIVYRDTDVVAQLGSSADVFLTHNRPIHVRCDDSVTRVIDGAESPIRRSRGYAPQPIRLPAVCEIPTLAVGGQLKSAFALAHHRQAFMSHHLGDLDHFEAARAFERDVSLYENLFEIYPRRIVHDLHPDYVSTRYARRRAETSGIQLLPIQHHHAHMASCMAENGLSERVIGVTFDGTGYGTDGAVWGGEFLVGDYRGFERAAHLRYVGMPGGDQAIKNPWRMALSHLLDAKCDDSVLADRIEPQSRRVVRGMIRREFNTAATSSAGRLFDAVSSLAGIRDHATYEGQAAIDMEHIALGVAPDGAYPFGITGDSPMIIDTRPLIRAIVADLKHGTEKPAISRKFHSTVVELVAAACRRIADSRGVRTVVFSGGVFLNAILSSECAARLAADGFRVFRHQRVPPNDGGICLGQLAIAAAMTAKPGNPMFHRLNTEPICASQFPAK
jgi:hydrogenase maturation protein HypF